MKTKIEVKKINKSFGDKNILCDFSLSIKQGEVVSFFGPNGCGKSTLMNILAGVIQRDSGSVQIDRENLSYVFQNYRESLLPWKNNYENISFPLEIKGVSKDEIKARITELEQTFGINFAWEGYPYNLSGGQQQTLSLFRALVTKPNIILIDEAFSALDFERNFQLREVLQKYYLKEKPTIIIVTHNIEEAVQLSQKVIVFPRSPVSNSSVVYNHSEYPRDMKYTLTDAFYKVRENTLAAFMEAIKT